MSDTHKKAYFGTPQVADQVKASFADLERQRLVRLRIEPDCIQYDDSYIDSWTDMTADERNHEKRELWRRIDREGVWILGAEWRASDDDAWERAPDGPICGFVGDDWRDSGYDIDIMRSAIDAVEEELSRRDPRSYMTPQDAERAGTED